MTGYVEQVGGDHYAKQGAKNRQHWDIIEVYDIAYLEANATKYVIRWDLKGKPTEDLEKARSYLNKMLSSHRGSRRVIPFHVLSDWYMEADLDFFKRTVCDLVLGTRSVRNVREAVRLIEKKLSELKTNEIKA